MAILAIHRRAGLKHNDLMEDGWYQYWPHVLVRDTRDPIGRVQDMAVRIVDFDLAEDHKCEAMPIRQWDYQPTLMKFNCDEMYTFLKRLDIWTQSECSCRFPPRILINFPSKRTSSFSVADTPYSAHQQCIASLNASRHRARIGSLLSLHSKNWHVGSWTIIMPASRSGLRSSVIPSAIESLSTFLVSRSQMNQLSWPLGTGQSRKIKWDSKRLRECSCLVPTHTTHRLRSV